MLIQDKLQCMSSKLARDEKIDHLGLQLEKYDDMLHYDYVWIDTSYRDNTPYSTEDTSVVAVFVLLLFPMLKAHLK